MTEAPGGSEIRYGSRVGRFVVDGELGSGGMGVVYAAHDRELDRHVALKVLRGAIDEESRMRLLREGQAMARVTHPNVITVYEVGVEGRMVFLAQELLDGGSLRQWLEKPRSQRDIVDKFVAAGRGLAAAHKVGLVHRDFKPDNVLLGKDGRVRVSDFGLARSLAALQTMADESKVDAVAKTTGDIMRSPMMTMTRTGAVMGTPLYMSPEQHRGEPTDERSDQFSFCIALYQSLYGDVPFPGKTAVALADAVIAGRMQPPPKKANVSARLRRILLRGLATDPKQRYSSMEALIADLLHDPARKMRRAGIIAGIALLVAGALVGGYMFSQTRSGSESRPAQYTIAVLGFKNLTADKANDSISPALSELLSTELAQGDSVRVIPSEDSDRARVDLALPNTESFSKETLQRLGARLGCNVVIVGSYFKAESGEITLNASIEDLHSGKSVRIKVTGRELPPIAKELGKRIRDELKITTLNLAKQAHEVLPKNPEAAHAFMEGRTALRAFDYATAKDKLLVAMKKEPDFAPGYIELARAYQGLFEGDAAAGAARKALEHVTTLGADQQLLVSGEAYELLGDTDKAREHYRRLFATNANVDYGFALLRVESPDGFANTAASVRKLGSDDPRIDVLDARMQLVKANPQRALELAQRATKKATEMGDVIVQAEARQAEGEADLALGQLAAAAAALDGSRKGFEGAGDRLSAIDVLELIAAVNLERGLLEDAFQQYDAVAELRMKAKLPEKAAIDAAAAAYALALRGRIAEAEKHLKDAEARKGTDPIAIPYVDLATAQIKWARGDVEAALKASDNCAARFAMAMGSFAILCSQINGEIRADRGDYDDAGKRFDEALATADAYPQRSDALKLLLAQLALEQISAADDKVNDKADAVIEHVKPIQASAAQRGAISLEAQAWTLIGRAHLLRADTLKTIDDLENVKADPQALHLRVQFQIAGALAKHIKEGGPDALAEINTLRAETDKQACIGLSLETRLARAQMLPADEGKAELEAVVRDAKAKGFGRIVKLAEGIAKPAEGSAKPQ